MIGRARRAVQINSLVRPESLVIRAMFASAPYSHRR